MPRTIKRTVASSEPTAVRLWLAEFVSLGSTIKTLTKRKDDLKERLAGAVEEDGTEDEKGHVWLELDVPVDGITQLKREKRVGQTADEERIEATLVAKGLRERCYRTVEVLDEDEIMAAHYEGLISAEEIDAMFPKKISYAFVPSKGR